MKTNSTLRNMMTASILVMLSGAAYAYDSSAVPQQPQTESTVAYVTGGIGEEEIASIESVHGSYSLHVVNTTRSGAYISETATVIQDRKGNDLLAVNAGPLLYVSLPAGRYKLSAEYEGVVQSKNFTITNKKPTELHLAWNVAD